LVAADVGQNMVQQSNIATQSMSYTPENAPQPWVAFTVSDADLNRGITEKGGYIKVFLADQPIDLGALSQGPLEQVFANYAPGSTQALLLDKELTGFTVPVVVYRQAQEMPETSGSMPPEDAYQSQSTAAPETETPLLPVLAYGSITAEEAPVYSAPAENATLVRTLPYGTRVEIVAENERWFRIQNIEKEMNEVRDLITDNQMGKVFAALEELKINNENIATINAQFFSARRDLEMGTMDQNAYQTAENRLIQELQNEIITLARTPEWVPAASVYKEDPAALA